MIVTPSVHVNITLQDLISIMWCYYTCSEKKFKFKLSIFFLTFFLYSFLFYPYVFYQDKSQVNHGYYTYSHLQKMQTILFNLTRIFLDGGLKLEYPEKTNKGTERTCKRKSTSFKLIWLKEPQSMTYFRDLLIRLAKRNPFVLICDITFNHVHMMYDNVQSNAVKA